MAKAHRSQNGLPPDGMDVTWLAWCFSEPDFDWLYGPYRWEPAPPPAAPTQAMATTLYEQLAGRMPDPTIVTTPPPGRASIIGIPVFVTVTNWTPNLTITDDIAGTRVTVTATPTLTYDPGEPDSTPITCRGGGTPFRRGHGTPDEQASRPGACTYAYTHRTGTAKRPRAWPASATVVWAISWTAADGNGGTFPPVTRRVALPRPVTEVQAILTTP